ncbi:MAG: ankyrin repeat domain-containing protein [Acidobacteriota bacterium]
MTRIGFCLAFLMLASTAGMCQDLNDQLIAASRKGDTAGARSLLEKGADVNAKTRYGATPLFFACDRGNVELVKLLIEKGADVDVRDTFYKASPIIWAAQKGHAEIVRQLLQKSPKGKDDAMSIGIGSGYPAIVSAVLELGELGQDALNNYLASANRAEKPEIVELLKKAGAKPIVLVEVKLSPEAIQAYNGVYRDERVEFSFSAKDSKLIFKPGPQREIILTCTAVHTFETADVPGLKLIFNLENEKIKSLTVKQPGAADMLLKKVEVQ